MDYKEIMDKIYDQRVEFHLRMIERLKRDVEKYKADGNTEMERSVLDDIANEQNCITLAEEERKAYLASIDLSK